MTEPRHTFIGVELNNKTVMGIRKFEAPMTYQDSLVNEARLIHVLKGNSSLICAGKTLSLKAGDTLLMKADNFINQWQKSGCESKSENTVEFIGFRFTQALIQTLYQDELSISVTQEKSTTDREEESAIVMSNSPLLSSYFQGIEHYITHKEILTDDMVALKIRELITLLLSQGVHHKLCNVQQLLSQLFVPSQPKLQAVVKAHLFTPLKVEELAFLCHMSESTFNRKFKQTFGTTVNKYFISKRLEKAEQLIKATEKSLTEIALDCGFEEISYFSRAFKQHFNMSPSHMRK